MIAHRLNFVPLFPPQRPNLWDQNHQMETHHTSASLSNFFIQFHWKPVMWFSFCCCVQLFCLILSKKEHTGNWSLHRCFHKGAEMQNDNYLSLVALISVNHWRKCLEILQMQFWKCQKDQTEEPKGFTSISFHKSFWACATDFFYFYFFFCQDSLLKFLIWATADFRVVARF